MSPSDAMKQGPGTSLIHPSSLILHPFSLAGRSVLFISYNEMLGGLGQSQVIPYLRALHHAEGVRFTLLSYEKPDAYTPAGAQRCAELKTQLAADGIEWHWLRYHSRPSLSATLYDVLHGTAYARKLIKRNDVEMIHARSHIPATIALLVKQAFRVPPLGGFFGSQAFRVPPLGGGAALLKTPPKGGTLNACNPKLLFDIRGLMAEEYVDAGHWQQDGLPFRLIKAAERRALAAAAGIVTLTQAIWPVICEWDGLRGRDVPHAVIPCCADLEKFRCDAQARAQRRAELGVNDRFVVVYSGSIDSWYLTDEMADFCAVMAQEHHEAFFLWLTPTRHERLHALMQARGLTQYAVCAARPDEVASYLCAADAGLAFIKPCFSKVASSPTKTAEYLGCGLPVILNAGIGDSDMLITEEKAGALVREFTPDAYRTAAHTVRQMAQDAATRPRMRDIALRLFDLHSVGGARYAELYCAILTT